MMITTRPIGMLLAILLLFGGIPTVSHAKIVFDSKRNFDTLYHIYVMEDNGTNVRRITNPNYYDGFAHWFPDGKRILFVRDLEQGSGRVNKEFYIMDADGLNAHRFMDNHPTDNFPVPSPDGKQIVFSSARAGKTDIYTYHLESKHLKQLTNHGGVNTPDWSPDGRKIAYRDASEEDKHIWTMNADGSGKRRLSPRHKKGMFFRRTQPRWSPSGKYIMYHEDQWKGAGNLIHGNWEQIKESIVVTNVHTGVQTVHKFPLEAVVLNGCWMGDDQTLLLQIKMDWEDPTDNFEIYRYDLVRRRLTNLTNHPGTDYYPHWISGPLAVSAAGKLTILWGELKKVDEN